MGRHCFQGGASVVKAREMAALDGKRKNGSNINDAQEDGNERFVSLDLCDSAAGPGSMDVFQEVVHGTE